MARKLATYRHRRLADSRGLGWRNTGNGTMRTPRTSGMFTSGLTGYTSMSAWETSARVCWLLLVLRPMEGKKFVGLLDGERESRLSWKELLLDNEAWT